MQDHTNVWIFVIVYTALFFSFKISAQSNLSSDEKQTIEQVLGVQFTGNKQQDALIYDQAKSLLKQNNPTLFDQYFGRKTQPGDFPIIPGFTPTGSYQNDLIAFQQAKYNLYMTDRAAYDELFSEKNKLVSVCLKQSMMLSLP